MFDPTSLTFMDGRFAVETGMIDVELFGKPILEWSTMTLPRLSAFIVIVW